jgi:hypothetical protein
MIKLLILVLNALAFIQLTSQSKQITDTSDDEFQPDPIQEIN